MNAQPRKRTVLNGQVHEGFGEKVANEPDVISLTAPEEETSCPACQFFMRAEEMGLPLQNAHREHVKFPAPSGLAAYVAAEKSKDYYEVLEKSRAIRLERLRAEYRPTMPPEVLHAWASDVTEALVPTEKPPVETNDRRLGL